MRDISSTNGEGSAIPQLLIASEIAKVLRISKSAVYALAATGTVPSIRIGRSVRFSLPAVLEALGGRNQA